MFSWPRMLYQFLGNKAEKGPSITTEVKVTLEQMYNGDSNGCLAVFFLLRVVVVSNMIMAVLKVFILVGSYIYKRQINMVQAIIQL